MVSSRCARQTQICWWCFCHSWPLRIILVSSFCRLIILIRLALHLLLLIFPAQKHHVLKIYQPCWPCSKSISAMLTSTCSENISAMLASTCSKNISAMLARNTLYWEFLSSSKSSPLNSIVDLYAIRLVMSHKAGYERPESISSLHRICLFFELISSFRFDY